MSESEQRDRASNNNIRVYGPDELEGECNLRYACAMGREVLDEGGKALKVGVTTDEIDRVVHEVNHSPLISSSFFPWFVSLAYVAF